MVLREVSYLEVSWGGGGGGGGEGREWYNYAAQNFTQSTFSRSENYSYTASNWYDTRNETEAWEQA